MRAAVGQRNCITCAYYVPQGCRRMPPTGAPSNAARFPHIVEPHNEWCGEHSDYEAARHLPVVPALQEYDNGRPAHPAPAPDSVWLILGRSGPMGTTTEPVDALVEEPQASFYPLTDEQAAAVARCMDEHPCDGCLYCRWGRT